jgi:hypothetical protein
MSDEATKPQPTDAPAEAAPKAPKAKKEKPPAVEDKPFAELMTQDFMPGLKKTLNTMGFEDVELALQQEQLPIAGLEQMEPCWQVLGRIGQRHFIVGFLKEDIQSQKFFCYSDSGARFSTLESFMIDERKVTLDLLLLYTVQRLNGQKWLVRN